MEKVYGVYEGNLKNTQEIEKLNETELFLAISSLENAILTYKRIMVRNAERCFDITEDEYALEYLIGRTEKFGVELEFDEQGKIIKSGDYASWYEFHMSYFNSSINFPKYMELKNKGYNVGQYLPNNSYLNYKKNLNIKSNQRVKSA